jgi:hypothetical protein
MTSLHGFVLRHEQYIEELKTAARLYRHEQTGAELLSLSNDDPNKVFCITFTTPPRDSTGVAHILEHSVLCGSRKYPVKEPFVELLKGSLQTFLNACTYPDKTCYPVASQNLRDFYNLIDVYLDAVFYPVISPVIFHQEGWHYEMDRPEDALSCKGVVFNEMKGAYSSAESLLAQHSQAALFPDTLYRLDAGGDPAQIPGLTYGQFRDFHRSYYHPSNSRIYFYGDDDPGERLRFMDGYLRDFDRRHPDSPLPQQPRIHAPRLVTRPFPAGAGAAGPGKGMVTVNWLLPATRDPDAVMTFSVLEYLLLGTPASPLRKALIDSGLGEGIAGIGLETDLAQLYLSAGLKGVAVERLEQVGPLVLDSLAAIVRDGIDRGALAAALNTIEFRLRENNSGRLPRGLLLLLRGTLTTWLHGGNPCDTLAFGPVLDRLHKRLAAAPALFEELIDSFLLRNLHRATVIMTPDPEMALRQEREERERLTRIQSALSREELDSVVDTTRQIKLWQQTPDSPAALAAIPRLTLADLERKNQIIPCARSEARGARILFHDLFTSGICYLDVGLNLHLLPQQYLSYVPLLGRALLETGTAREDFVGLSQHIGRATGGIRTSLFTSGISGSRQGTAWQFLRAKAMRQQVPELLAILSDVLHTARLDNRERLQQILAEEKAAQEQKLIPHGHQVVGTRLRARFNEADWADEQMSGISYLLFLRELERGLSANRNSLPETLEKMRQLLIGRPSLVINVTADAEAWREIESHVHGFLERFPERSAPPAAWTPAAMPAGEGLVVPSLINFVGKAVNLYDLGYCYGGSIQVMTQVVRSTWLWEQVRVQGGAYGAFCSFDRMSGGLVFVSYRDPNLLETLAVFDRTANFLRKHAPGAEELSRSIIGTIGDIDAHLLPDARGFVCLQRFLNGNTDELRQKMRDEILGTTPDDLRALAVVLDHMKDRGAVAVLGSGQKIKAANKTLNGLLQEQTLL